MQPQTGATLAHSTSESPALQAQPAPPEPGDWLRPDAPRTLIGFDFDGTLVELAPRPDLIHYAPGCLAALRSLGECPPKNARVILCSGRSVRDLSHYAPDSMDLIGSHGLEWRISGQVHSWISENWWSWREKHHAMLLQMLHEHGGELEDKKVSYTIHFRSAPRFWSTPEALARLRSIAGEEVGIMPGTLCWNLVGLGLAPGMEHPAAMSKGMSMIQFARQEGFERIVYFGDEPTDETVFVRKELPVLGVRVGLEGESAAAFRLPSVTAVHSWLSALAALGARTGRG